MAPVQKGKKTVQALILTHNAEIKEVSLPLEKDGSLTAKNIQTVLKKKADAALLGTYKYKSMGLFLFGYLAGKAGQENKHELPPPCDTTLAFGDILLVASKDIKSWTFPISFKAEEYEAFYTKAYGGFEDLDSDEEEEEVIEEEDTVEEGRGPEVAEDLEEDEAEAVDDDNDSDGSEAEEDDAEGDEADGVEGEEAEEVPSPKKRAVAATGHSTAGAGGRAKKTKRSAASSSSTNPYTAYIYVSKDDELKPEAFNTTDFSVQESVPKRVAMVETLKRIFQGLITSHVELQTLERCIYMATLRTANQRHVGKTWSHPPFLDTYNTVAKHIIGNLSPRSYIGNTDLFSRYKSGQISFEDISTMDTYQLFEDRWHDSFVMQQMREKRQLEGNKAMATDRFLCSRCHKRECTYYEMQTRSADEPMTIFITCLNCGKHWRQ